MNHPTSYHRQDWSIILFLSVTIWLATFVGLLLLTWSWLTPWPALSVHVDNWLNGLSGLVFNHSLRPWLSYWQTLVARDWHWPFTLHCQHCWQAFQRSSAQSAFMLLAVETVIVISLVRVCIKAARR